MNSSCGVRHRQQRVTREIPRNSKEYAASLRITAHLDMAGQKGADAASPEFYCAYRSLLGVVALLLLTCIDVAVCVSALQRWGHAPKRIDVRRLNILTKVDTGKPEEPDVQSVWG